MATGHRINTDLYNSAMSASNIIKDPGGTDSFTTTGTIKVDIAGGICKLDSGDGNKRKLQSPATVPEGVEITIVHASADGGDLDIQYDGRLLGALLNNIEMDNDGDWVRLVVLEVASIADSTVLVKRWYRLMDSGIGLSLI